MIVNPTTLNRIYQNLRKDFEGAYKGEEVLYTKYCSVVPSNTRSNLQAWLGGIGGMREWLGPRVYNNLTARTFEAVNKSWEDSIEVDRESIEDDTFGLYGQAAALLGEMARVHPDQVMAATVEAGLTAVSFDGQPFFDSDHPVNPDNPSGDTYQNRFDASVAGGSSARALTPANYDHVRTAMRKFKREDGSPLVVSNKLLLMVPPDLETAGKQILQQDWLAPGAAFGAGAANVLQPNPNKGTAELLVNPYLTSTARWYLIAMGSVVKPFVFQLRKAPEFTAMDSMTDEAVFTSKKFRYGVYARYVGTYSLPFLACTGSTES